MLPLSCSNCWYNPLQHGALGLAVGYCVQHNRVLPAADETTCGLLRRKDLPLPLALAQSRVHGNTFKQDRIALLRRSASPGPSEKPDGILRDDPVGDAVGHYGLLGSKIETMARLRSLPGARAEVAMLSLGRGYVSRCVERGGRWTSGLHLLWWTLQRLDAVPEVGAGDLRVAPRIPMARFVDLTRWSVVMLRILFVADVAERAGQDPLHALARLPDGAARSVRPGESGDLLQWLGRQRERLSRGLSEARYVRLARELHRSREQRDPAG